MTARSQSAPPAADAASPRFGWWACAAHVWILSGLLLDGWFHNNSPQVETFFTPWHGVLYSGVGVAVAVIGEQMLRARRRGVSWRSSIPVGYGLAVIGGAVFVGGAMADMAWHELLGIEVGVEALLSPTHLTLAVAGFLVFTGPLRAAQRTVAATAPAADIWPAVLSVAFVVTLIGFFTQYVNPLTHLYPVAVPGAGEVDLLNAAGIAGILLFAAVLAAAVLVVVLRWRPPVGALFAIVVIPAAAMATQQGTYQLLPGVILAGLACEVLSVGLRPAADRVAAARITAAAVPALVVTSYVLTLGLTGDVRWSVHLLTGAVALSAIAGALVGLAMTTPQAVAAPLSASADGSLVRRSDIPARRTDERATAGRVRS